MTSSAPAASARSLYRLLLRETNRLPYGYLRSVLPCVTLFNTNTFPIGLSFASNFEMTLLPLLVQVQVLI